MNLVGDLLKKYNQFFKFGLVGLINTLTSLIIYYVMVYLNVHYQIANIAAFLISSFNGFLLNRSWVFKPKGSSFLVQLMKYYVVYCSSLLISIVLSFVWIELLTIDKYIAPLLNLCLTVPYNYFFNKIWALRSDKD